MAKTSGLGNLLGGGPAPLDVTGSVERYLRPVVTTTGGFSALSYVLTVVRNQTAVSF